jgi:Mce-associated membrane protein
MKGTRGQIEDRPADRSEAAADPGEADQGATGEVLPPGEPTADDVAATDAPADDQSRDGAAGTRAEGHGRRGDRRLATTALVAFVVTGLAVIVGGVAWYVWAQHDHHQRNDAITVAARDEALALLVLSPENVQATFDKVLANSTGGWRQEFAQQADQFTQVVRKGQVRSQATISESGIQTADDNHAVVLVSANAVIHNVDSPQGYPGVYRILMNLQRQDGRWLVSDLQFVP